MKVLGLSGSLRAASINSALLRAAARLAPAGMEITLSRQLGELPLFNPDLESQLPIPVSLLYDQIALADGLLIASPEYAHGISGVLKNALDWLVSFAPFVNKPIAIINTSARAQHADAALREVLTTMSARIVEPASITVPLLSAGLSEDAIVADPIKSAATVEALLVLQSSAAVSAVDRDPKFSI